MDRMEKAAAFIFGCICLLCLGGLVLLGWGFIEIIQWITSK